ncbi:MAG: M4 family metallopeptidase, partial [Myxococcota bacterium]
RSLRFVPLTALLATLCAHCAVDGTGPARQNPSDPSPAADTPKGDNPSGGSGGGQDGPVTVLDPQLGTASFFQPRGASTPVLEEGASAQQAALEVIAGHATALGIDDPDSEMVLESISYDALGGTHVTFRQVADGVPVFGVRFGVHFDKLGRTAYMSGRYVPDLDTVDTTPALDVQQAMAAAEADLAAYAAPDQLTEPLEEPTAQLVVWALEDTPRLAYEIEIAYAEQRVVAMDYLVDAKDGTIIRRTPAIRAITAEASGGGSAYHARDDQTDIKTFLVTQIGTEASPGGIKYRMMKPATEESTAITVRDRTLSFPYWVESTDLNQWDTGGISPGQAVDAYVHLEMVDAYHRKVHGRASYDGAGSPMTVFAHDPIAYDNAAWYKGRVFSGDIIFAAPDLPYVAGLDVVAHEFQHGVNGATLDLVYESQSGAIDEALADIFGCFVERHYAPDDVNNFLIAEASTLPHRSHPIRNLKDPASQNDPSHMDEYRDWPVDEDNDLGGVHENSTIPGHAWYLMTVGGTHALSGVEITSPIGWAESEKLFNAVVEGRAQSPTASFTDFARVTIATAYQLEGASVPDETGQQVPAVPEVGQDGEVVDPPSPVRAVGCAWLAVGVLDEQELQEHWGIACDEDAGAAPELDCFTGGQACGGDQVCSWNGDGYCCKAPWEGEKTCFTDKECEPGICSRGANDRFYCTMPDAQPCQEPSSASGSESE